MRTLEQYPGIRIGEDGVIVSRTGRTITSTAGRYVSVPVRLADGRETTVGAHVLVALAWIGPRPDGHEVAHQDGDTRHNHASNLRWSTHANNCADKVEHGTVQHGESNGNRKLTEQDVREIRAAAERGESGPSIGRRYGVTRQNVGFIVRRETWGHVQ